MRISDWSSDVCSSDLSSEESAPCKLPPDQIGARWHLIAKLMAGAGRGLMARRQIRIPDAALARRRHVSFGDGGCAVAVRMAIRSEEHTSELQSPMRIPHAVFFFNKKKTTDQKTSRISSHHKSKNTEMI